MCPRTLNPEPWTLVCVQDVPRDPGPPFEPLTLAPVVMCVQDVPKNEDSLRKAVAQQPIAVGICATYVMQVCARACVCTSVQ